MIGRAIRWKRPLRLAAGVWTILASAVVGHPHTRGVQRPQPKGCLRVPRPMHGTTFGDSYWFGSLLSDRVGAVWDSESEYMRRATSSTLTPGAKVLDVAEGYGWPPRYSRIRHLGCRSFRGYRHRSPLAGSCFPSINRFARCSDCHPVVSCRGRQPRDRPLEPPGW